LTGASSHLVQRVDSTYVLADVLLTDGPTVLDQLLLDVDNDGEIERKWHALSPPPPCPRTKPHLGSCSQKQRFSVSVPELESFAPLLHCLYILLTIGKFAWLHPPPPPFASAVLAVVVNQDQGYVSLQLLTVPWEAAGGVGNPMLADPRQVVGPVTLLSRFNGLPFAAGDVDDDGDVDVVFMYLSHDGSGMDVMLLSSNGATEPVWAPLRLHTVPGFGSVFGLVRARCTRAGRRWDARSPVSACPVC
jgi:hypothetical protein